MYEKGMIAIDNFKQKLVFVKIHNLLPKGCKEENKKRACTLGFRRLNIETCKKADYVLGLVDSEVVTIFRVDESSWYNHKEDLSKLDEFTREFRKEDIENYPNNKAGRVFFTGCCKNIEPEIEQLRNKVIYYKEDDKYIKLQNTHYSMNLK